jgi:hypothetical protein
MPRKMLEETMRTKTVLLTVVALLLVAGLLTIFSPAAVEGQGGQSAPGFGAVPGEKGGLDITGPYEVVADWPKPLAGRLCRESQSGPHGAAGRIAAPAAPGGACAA